MQEGKHHGDLEQEVRGPETRGMDRVLPIILCPVTRVISEDIEPKSARAQ